MKRRLFKLGLWVFTLGVLLVVLRPFVAYQLVPRVNLQRLVKKKEERHDMPAEALINAPGDAQHSLLKFFRISRVRIPAFYWRMTVREVILTAGRYLPVQHQRYRLCSCFLI